MKKNKLRKKNPPFNCIDDNAGSLCSVALTRLGREK